MLNKPTLRAFTAWLIALLAAASMWCYADFILVPHQKTEAAQLGRPRGNLSDLYPRWLGARELLLHGRDPYGAPVTREIQAGYYGRPLDPSRPNDPQDQQGFAYPIYVVFLLAATIHWPFTLVQMVCRWVLLLLLTCSVPLWQRALGCRISVLSLAIWVILVLGSFPAVQGIKLQQLSIVVCALLAACAAALAEGHFILAGILLAVSTIKPQLAGIFAAWLGIWTASQWRVRQPLAWSFGLSMLALVGGGEILLPGWIMQFRAAASAYWQYTAGGKSLLDLSLTPAWGRSAAVVIVLLLATFCWRVRREPAGSEGFAWTLAVLFALTLLVIPTFAPYNQLLLLPALLMIVQTARDSWQRGGIIRVFLILTAITVLWPWLSALALDVMLLVLPPTKLQQAWAVPLWPSLPLPVAVAALVSTLATRRALWQTGK